MNTNATDNLSAPDPLSLERVMQRYQAGDRQAASELITRLSPQMFAFFLAQVRDRYRAEDLLQEFWLRIHKARSTFRPTDPLLPWLYAIARRVQIDEYRRKSRIQHHEFQSEILPELAPPQQQKHPVMSVEHLVKDLPASQREAVLLLKVAGLSLEEAARAMNTTVGAVKQKSHRALQTMRRIFAAKSDSSTHSGDQS